MPLKVDSLISNSVNATTIVQNGTELCPTITTQVYYDEPFIITPKLEQTCIKIQDTSENGLNLKGYKVVGSVILNGDTSYFIYLGTLIIKNGNLAPVIPPSFKTSGTVAWFPSAPAFVTESLGLINRGWDTNGDTIYIQTDFVNFINTNGDDLLIDVLLNVGESDLNPTPLVSDLEVTISFEVEFFLFENQEVTLEFLP